ncbi:uncharacterized protein LOC123219344 [Mangifera indica]|uniref:uncharacterized protein LOC123219344 n=1 Tax=Mangifera indica TaxID=29780 RepID=UPI001CFB5F7B|nr:uncharacterized protein LOC123219344 [Mangifera indica]
MAKWLSISSNNHNDMVTAHLPSQKSGTEFMQNCDLPPPTKVFSGSDKMVISSMNRICGMVDREEEDRYDFEACRSCESEKLEILKALRLSQTRAREAEKKAASFAEERDTLYSIFLQDSLRIFAYRQWVRLLEVQASKLQKTERHSLCCCGAKEGDDDGKDGAGVSLFMALAFCLGIVGVGFAIGCKYLF